MPLDLQETTDADMPRAFELLSQAFGHEHPYVDHCFPAHDTPEGRKIGGERLQALRKVDECATSLKVVDTDTGKMIAHGKWYVLDGYIPPQLLRLDLQPGDYWGSPEEREYAQHLFREFFTPRAKAIQAAGGKIVALDILTVDPEYQRRGAGRLIVKWGTAMADKLGFPAVVEASDYGRGLYQSEGFEPKEAYVLPLPEKWADREKQRYTWMIRPARNLSGGNV